MSENSNLDQYSYMSSDHTGLHFIAV